MDWLLLLGFVLMWLPVVLLVLGGREPSEENSSRGELRSANEASFENASFFLKPEARQRPAPPRGGKDQTVCRLQDYLRAEHEEAERFVSSPSVGTLYRNCGQGF